MGTRIIKVKGGTKEEVLNKQYNIFIGISLGNKWFIKENLREYIKWALENTKERVLIWIADKIHAVNYEVKNNQNSERALMRSIKDGDRVLRIINEILEELPHKKRKLIDVARKDDLENLEYKKLKEFFYQKFKLDKKFRSEVFNIVKSTISLNLNELKIERLSEYVLNEFPMVLSSFVFKGVDYGCCPYPVSTKISEFVEKIQKQEIFPEIKNKLKFNNMVCVQLEVN